MNQKVSKSKFYKLNKILKFLTDFRVVEKNFLQCAYYCIWRELYVEAKEVLFLTCVSHMCFSHVFLTRVSSFYLNEAIKQHSKKL